MEKMMSNTKHTPTPWRVVNGNLIKDEFMPFDRDEAETALIATATGHTAARTEANAAFIVRAVNSHEQLVAVAKLAKSLTEFIGTNHGGNMALVDEASTALIRIKMALAAAEA